MTVCAGLRFGPFMGPRSPRTPKKKTGEHRKISEDGDANLQNIRDLTSRTSHSSFKFASAEIFFRAPAGKRRSTSSSDMPAASLV